jgi:hypothetical protein
MPRKKFRNDFEAATKNSVANYKLVQVLTSKKKWWSNIWKHQLSMLHLRPLCDNYSLTQSTVSGRSYINRRSSIITCKSDNIDELCAFYFNCAYLSEVHILCLSLSKKNPCRKYFQCSKVKAGG